MYQPTSMDRAHLEGVPLHAGRMPALHLRNTQWTAPILGASLRTPAGCPRSIYATPYGPRPSWGRPSARRQDARAPFMQHPMDRAHLRGAPLHAGRMPALHLCNTQWTAPILGASLYTPAGCPRSIHATPNGPRPSWGRPSARRQDARAQFTQHPMDRAHLGGAPLHAGRMPALHKHEHLAQLQAFQLRIRIQIPSGVPPCVIPQQRNCRNHRGIVRAVFQGHC